MEGSVLLLSSGVTTMQCRVPSAPPPFSSHLKKSSSEIVFVKRYMQRTQGASVGVRCYTAPPGVRPNFAGMPSAMPNGHAQKFSLGL